MYIDKIKDTEEELEKVRISLKEHLNLEQRLLGRLITLQELQEEIDIKESIDDAVENQERRDVETKSESNES